MSSCVCHWQLNEKQYIHWLKYAEYQSLDIAPGVRVYLFNTDHSVIMH